MKHAEASVVCAKEEKTIFKAKKSQLEQYFTSQIPSLTKVEHDEATKLLAHAWCDILLFNSWILNKKWAWFVRVQIW